MLPAPSAPPGPDWLPGLKPNQHWPTRLSLEYSSAPSGRWEPKPDYQKRISEDTSDPGDLPEVGPWTVGDQTLSGPEFGLLASSARTGTDL